MHGRAIKDNSFLHQSIILKATTHSFRRTSFLHGNHFYACCPQWLMNVGGTYMTSLVCVTGLWRPENNILFSLGLTQFPCLRPHRTLSASRTPIAESWSILKFRSRDGTPFTFHVCGCPPDVQKGRGELCLLSEYGGSEKVPPSLHPLILV